MKINSKKISNDEEQAIFFKGIIMMKKDSCVACLSSCFFCSPSFWPFFEYLKIYLILYTHSILYCCCCIAGSSSITTTTPSSTTTKSLLASCFITLYIYIFVCWLGLFISVQFRKILNNLKKIEKFLEKYY